MSVQKLNNSNPYKHNGGTLFGAGSTLGGAVTATVGYGRPELPAFNSIVYSGVAFGITPLDTDLNFNQLNQHLIMGVTTALGGVASKALKYTGTSIGSRKNLHILTTRKTLHIQGWDYQTGQPTGVVSTTDDNFGDDHEATNVGRTSNGEYTQMLTGAQPTTRDYPLKTG